MFTFESPQYLYLAALIIPLTAWFVWRRNKQTANLQVSTISPFKQAPKSLRYYILHLPFILRMIALALLCVILARPQSNETWSDQNVEGIDIMMSLDISGSMLAEDLKPNRLEAAKSISAEFVNSRPNDNIGLVVFSGESFTQCPLTTDKAALSQLFSVINEQMIQANGTAIGLGLASAVNRLKDSQAKSKVIILLTDGSNNTGEIDPTMASELAKSFGIRVYTIGVGTKGMAPYPFQTAFGVQRQMVPVDIDEGTLKSISANTDGKYFRATDNKSLKAIYEEIDQLEKTKISVQEYSKKNEEYLPFALALIGVLLLEFLVRYLVVRHNP
ncbi:MAG: VWA domain-containing protein [Bacteroidales bacterium]|nr:VWA domain-containing protein [Candidatus Scybalocola fimicaballi]